MKKDLPKTYDPKLVESAIYDMWMENDCFKAEPDPDKKPYSIVMPPPNVTGQLHMGHALDSTLQDILTRYKRMEGYSALWLPGTDHAGIATQIKVEEELRVKEGKTRYDLGREKFLERVWAWKEKYGSRIVEQQRKLGVSCDWSRSRFTMDEGCSRAVREAFCEMYDKGLIYKGSRIINWCPHCLTALSDAEVEYVDKPGHLWYIRYPLSDGSGDIVVATTRPETMMGDTGVAVNPNDEKFQHLIGKTCILPIMNREIPIVGDEYCEIGFGTGAVKMTPAHDPNDFEVGLRHNLDVIRVIADNGTINENGGKYNGMDRYECRKALVKDLEEQGYLVKTEPYSHNVGTCYRCHNDVEPLISAQWFVKMKPLAEEAIRVVKDGTIKFVPERFSKTYLNWMENVHDWCISRQLWWGHQIPAWYCDECGHINVSREDPTKCEKCGCTHLTRDEDVLDTWFSSGLWPFSTLGWPDLDSEDLKYWYPTTDMVTGYDIIFFWVARMVVSGMEQMKKEPFKTVFIHGLVRDDKGRKMSKSLGNGIDPLEMAEKYGADALRFNLITGNSPGNDMRFYVEKCEAMRNFANKIWNASRYRAHEPDRGQRPACPMPPILRSRTSGSCQSSIRSSKKSPRIWTPTSSAWPPPRSMTSSGTPTATGISSSPRPDCTARMRRASSPRRRCWSMCSTSSCGCCIRSCRSSPRRSGRPSRTRASASCVAEWPKYDESLNFTRRGSAHGVRHGRHPRHPQPPRRDERSAVEEEHALCRVRQGRDLPAGRGLHLPSGLCRQGHHLRDRPGGPREHGLRRHERRQALYPAGGADRL